MFTEGVIFFSAEFRSAPSFGMGSSAELGMPRKEHFLPRNSGNRSESIPRNFFGTKFRSQPYVLNLNNASYFFQQSKYHLELSRYFKRFMMESQYHRPFCCREGCIVQYHIFN